MKPLGTWFSQRTRPRRLGPYVKTQKRNPRGRGRAYPLGTQSYLMAASLLPWRPLQVSWIAFVPKVTLPKVSFRLDSVWHSFSAKHSNRQKTAIWAGPPVNRLVPKIIQKCKIKPVIIQNRWYNSMEQSKIIDTLQTYQASPSLIPARPRVGKS